MLKFTRVGVLPPFLFIATLTSEKGFTNYNGVDNLDITI